MAGRPNESLRDIPIDFWRARFEVKDKTLVWRAKPLEEFANKGVGRAWNERYAGKPAGTFSNNWFFVKLAGVGNVPVDKLIIALETGAWPDRYQEHNGKPYSPNIGQSPLNRLLIREAKDAGLSFDDLTVLSAQRDPFRLDTPPNHEMGHWVSEHFARLVGDRTIHWRGLHYVRVSAGGIIKPNGRRYEKNHADYMWLTQAARSARWLGYVDTERLLDNRNDEPRILRAAGGREEPQTYGMALASLGISTPTNEWLTIPSAHVERPSRYADIWVYPVVSFPDNPPPRYALALFAEKSSLAAPLTPSAQRFGADLYCGAGEASDIHLERMARDACADGRTLVVFCFSDFDPSGWQMPISVARKLQAFKVWKYPTLEFQVVRGA